MRCCHVFRPRRALTLIELCVVISIIGLLCLLLLPAVQRSREASRRLVCENNLKQLGTAIAGFNTANNAFPSGIMPSPISSAGRPIAVGPVSAHFQLLPFLEQSNLFNSMNLQGSLLTDTANRPENRTASRVTVAVLICPSDSYGSLSGNNYRASVGPHPFELEGSAQPGGQGAFPGLKNISAQEFGDGLTTTSGFSERVVGGADSKRFDPNRDIWFSGFARTSTNITSDIILGVCEIGTRAPAEFWPEAGRSWLPGRFADTLYNHVAPPNTPVADCSIDAPFGAPGDISGGSVAARSNHTGGINVMFMDSSVRWVNQGVNLSVWRALATRNGGEVLNADR